MFIDREKELAFFNQLLTRRKPGPAQLALLYGRRRVGKTALLLQWAQSNALPHIYWTAEKEPAALQRRKLYARILDLPIRQAPQFDTWAELWDSAANLFGSERRILILDELPYAAESDPAALSALQHAWDHHFQDSNLVIVLCGSQVKAMESLQFQGSPLFGRLTGQWHLQPLPFSALREFFPDWLVEQRIAAYAIVGGVPAYLNWLDPQLSLVGNIRQVVLAEGGMFLAEPTFLLYDEVREPGSYLAVLKALGLGYHTLGEISRYTGLATSHLSAYLGRLEELKIIERRLPAALPASKRRRSHQGRYHMQDPFFRFYFSFIAPYFDYLPFDTEQVLERTKRNLRAFVGGTIFEDLARQWVLQSGRAGRLPFAPEIVGSHWSNKVQIDVAAVNWQERRILLGECKWGGGQIGRKIVRELVNEKAPTVLADLPESGKGWDVHYAIFSRNGLTPAAVREFSSVNGLVVSPADLDEDLE